MTPEPNSVPADRPSARRSLEGLALGDAFGERWFPLFRDRPQAYAEIRARLTPQEPAWHWTDDTAMALGVLRVLDRYGEVRPHELAQAFALGHDADPARGYGHGMHQLLPRLLQEPERWPELARQLFDGEGSLGNGAAMRVAPLGAWFHRSLPLVAEQAAATPPGCHPPPE
ncbi:ADP-ribosylglycohydrolase family protein, partial [Streptomyces sp. NPDC059466]|uniref:ADP-ribosylglycohydrolase family protein n=1 Tax=Streptomyces sp. NPDC059466 TaxID=3346843 RepID=UPI0036B00888